MKLLEDFDPRPLEYRGTAASHLPALLETVREQKLCISLLFDPECQHWDDTDAESNRSGCHMPDMSSLKVTISVFKDCLKLSEEQICYIEQNTRDQRLSPLWHSSQKCRISLVPYCLA